MSSARNTRGKLAARRGPDNSPERDLNVANQLTSEQQAQRKATTQGDNILQRETPAGDCQDTPEGSRDEEEHSSEGERFDPENPAGTLRGDEGAPLGRPFHNHGDARSALPIGLHRPAVGASSLHRTQLAAEFRASHMHHDNQGPTDTAIRSRLGTGDDREPGSRGPVPAPTHTLTSTVGTREWVAQLTSDLWAAEDRGEPEERLAKLRERVATANQLLTARAIIGEPAGRLSSDTDDASKLMRALNAATPRPKLGEQGKAATPQQVEQWIKDVEGVFAMAAVSEDSQTRTLWVLGTISYGVHRELLMQRLRDGPSKGWDWVKNEGRSLVQDPLFTKYENYVKFFNFVWKDSDTVNSFLLQLSKRESLLPRSFFKTPDDQDDDEAKIAFVWSRIPDVMRREMQRHGAFEAIQTWSDFERALRNAETANRALSAPNSTQGSTDAFSGRRGKRPNAHNDQGGKRQDRKPSTQSGRASPNRTDSGSKSNRSYNSQYSSNKGYGDRRDDRRREDSHEGRRDNSRHEDRQDGKQPQHWKQRNRGDQGKTDKSGESGKANP